MNKPSWISTNVNIVTLVGVLFAGGGFYYTTTLELAKMEEFRQERTRQTDSRFAELTREMARFGQELPMLGHRVTATEASLKQINERMDVAFNSFSARLDRSAETTAAGLASITAAIAALDTRVAVLTQRVESLNPDRRAQLPEPSGAEVR